MKKSRQKTNCLLWLLNRMRVMSLSTMPFRNIEIWYQTVDNKGLSLYNFNSLECQFLGMETLASPGILHVICSDAKIFSWFVYHIRSMLYFFILLMMMYGWVFRFSALYFVSTLSWGFSAHKESADFSLNLHRFCTYFSRILSRFS